MTNEELKAAIGTLRYHIEINANQDWFLRDHGPSLLQAARELSQLKDGTHPDMVMVPREHASKCNLCHRDAINVEDAYEMVRYLLPLAKGYVDANPGIRSTECIIEDAEAMIAVAQKGNAK